MVNKENIVSIMWEDSKNHPHSVGLLAQRDLEENKKEFYMSFKADGDIENAISHGFIVPSGIIKRYVYKSDRLFELFRQRLKDKYTKDPLGELIKTGGGRSLVDSFYVEDNISEDEKADRINLLLEAYELQERQAQIRANNKDEK